MRSCRWFWMLSLISAVGCTHLDPSVQRSSRQDNVRLAQVQLSDNSGSAVLGTINFEQMPNSTIVMLHLEGLKPKTTYQIYVDENVSCRSAKTTSATSLLEFRTNKQGVAENTFKTELYSVSGSKPLLGSSILVVSGPSPGKRQSVSKLACGEAQPQMSGSSSQSD